MPLTAQNIKLNTNNPARRDVVLLPANGFVVIAFKADNPGSWVSQIKQDIRLGNADHSVDNALPYCLPCFRRLSSSGNGATARRFESVAWQ